MVPQKEALFGPAPKHGTFRLEAEKAQAYLNDACCGRRSSDRRRPPPLPVLCGGAGSARCMPCGRQATVSMQPVGGTPPRARRNGNSGGGGHGRPENNHVNVRSLRPYDRTPTHSKTQIRQIAASIREFGFCNPVLVTDGLGLKPGTVESRLPSYSGSTLCRACTSLIRATRNGAPTFWRTTNWPPRQDGSRIPWPWSFNSYIDLNFDVELTGFSVGEVDPHHWCCL